MMLCMLLLLVALALSLADQSKYIVMDGFSWAENLAFDGRGSLFVSDAVKGQLVRVRYNETSQGYDSDIFLKAGVTQLGGLAVTPDGLHIYCGAKLGDKSPVIIRASTLVPMKFDVIANTTNLANGLAADWKRNTLYFTDEGTGQKLQGTLTSLNLDTLAQGVAATVPSADGAFFDAKANKLYIGELVSKKIHVFSVTDNGISLDSVNTGLSEAIGAAHIIDDITLDLSGTNTANINDTVLFAADWTGRKIQRFTLDGKTTSTLQMPEGVTLKEPTSVRWGKGPGFDANSLYVSEGGGATKLESGRRIVQIPMGGR